MDGKQAHALMIDEKRRSKMLDISGGEAPPGADNIINGLCKGARIMSGGAREARPQSLIPEPRADRRRRMGEESQPWPGSREKRTGFGQAPVSRGSRSPCNFVWF